MRYFVQVLSDAPEPRAPNLCGCLRCLLLLGNEVTVYLWAGACEVLEP